MIRAGAGSHHPTHEHDGKSAFQNGHRHPPIGLLFIGSMDAVYCRMI
jgi:hypothetical protein